MFHKHQWHLVKIKRGKPIIRFYKGSEYTCVQMCWIWSCFCGAYLYNCGNKSIFVDKNKRRIVYRNRTLKKIKRRDRVFIIGFLIMLFCIIFQVFNKISCNNVIDNISVCLYKCNNLKGQK